MNTIKPNFTPAELLDQGFTFSDEGILDGEDYYKSYSYNSNSSELCITHEHDAWGDIVTETIDFNFATLKGEKPTWKDL